MTDGTKQHQTFNFTTNITITTLNVNGLHDGGKRQKLFQTIQNKKSHITLLQETHSNPEQATNGKKKGRDYPIGTRVKHQNDQG